MLPRHSFVLAMYTASQQSFIQKLYDQMNRQTDGQTDGTSLSTVTSLSATAFTNPANTLSTTLVYLAVALPALVT